MLAVITTVQGDDGSRVNIAFRKLKIALIRDRGNPLIPLSTNNLVKRISIIVKFRRRVTLDYVRLHLIYDISCQDFDNEFC